MADWVVWPLFLMQLIAFILIWLPNKKAFIRYYHISFILIIVINILIVLSLYHDSTDVLHLYF